MNAAVGLCIFCEVHGPKVIFVTETHRDLDDYGTEELKFYGPKSILEQSRNAQTEQRCDGCTSLGNFKYLSNDHETRTSFLSAQQPLSQDVAKFLHYACVRSLSCEVHADKEGVCYFGDEIRGHVLSRTFSLKDAKARGFRKWCSFVILTRDKQFLLNLWLFLTENLEKVVSELQSFAEGKFRSEDEECSSRAARVATTSSGESSKRSSSKQPRSLVEITAEKHIFVRIHMRLTWILSAGAQHFVEILPRNLLDEDNIFEAKPGTDEAPILGKKNTNLVSMESLPITDFGEMGDKNPATIARALRKALGNEKFRQILYATLTGVQVLVRGPRLRTLEYLHCLCFLVPEIPQKVKAFATEYEGKSECNFIGVDNSVAVPLPCTDVCRLDILSTEKEGTDSKSHILKWNGELPKKLPTLLIKIEKSLDNEIFNDSILKTHLTVLKEEWKNIAEMVWFLKARGNDKTRLIQSLGGGPHDETLVDSWCKKIQNL